MEIPTDVCINNNLAKLCQRFKVLPSTIAKINMIKSPKNNLVRSKLFDLINKQKFTDVFDTTAFYNDTLKYDVSWLTQLTKLGFIPLDSQPGEMTETASQRAYVSGALVCDEAFDLYDLINRTDIIAIINQSTCSHTRLPVTYEYTNMDFDMESFAGNAPKWEKPKDIGDSDMIHYPPSSTALTLGMSELDELPELFESDGLEYITIIDPTHGRLASEYLYPQILIPLMQAIRKMYDVC